MFSLLIWWYLVAYSPDPWALGSPIGEFTSLDGEGGCLEQLDLYYLRNPRGMVRCEGSPQRQNFHTELGRKKQELELKKLELDVENRALEAEIRRRVLKGQLNPDAKAK